jgi:hypothetical protein
MQKESRATDGGMAVDMEELARALSVPCAGSGARACEQLAACRRLLLRASRLRPLRGSRRDGSVRGA